MLDCVAESSKSTPVPVCIIGCGPIDLTGALLLSRLGIKSLLVERRGERNTHPRSRFVDTLTVNEYARIPSPTFHTVPRDSSPCLPVMTCQDYVEGVLLDKAEQDSNIDLRFHTEVVSLEQNDQHTRVVLRDLEKDSTEEVVALCSIGADGPGSGTRAVIGSELETDPRPINSQDVIFDADLSKYVEGRKGALLYTMPGPGAGVIFQPLDGLRRWRCQVMVATPDLISEEEVRQRIRVAIGSDDDIPITINSMRMWQPTPGCTSHFSSGRIFLAGDAAHISIPTGGMGNNSGFAGIRNLAWKLAFVLKGISPPEILETYNEEHRAFAQQRIDAGVAIFEAMGPMMIKQLMGEDYSADVHATRIYGNYDGVLLGFELRSGLIAQETNAPPTVDDPIMDFIHAVRAGRRAPHIWIDEYRTRSLLDLFGTGYVLILGAEVGSAPWLAEIARLSAAGVPVTAAQLAGQSQDSPYTNDGVVLVRPDGIIAAHWSVEQLQKTDATSCLTLSLPLLVG